MNKNIVSAFAGLALMVTLTACGGGGGASEKDLLNDLKDQGFTDSLANCVMDEVKSKAGSLDEYADMKQDAQQTMAAEAGAECAKDASPEEIAGAAEGIDADLSDPQLRESIVTGMTSSGVPEKLANCILDAAIEQDLTPADFMDVEKITPITESCADAG